MSSFMQGAQTGLNIINQGFDAYDRRRDLKDKMAQRAQTKKERDEDRDYTRMRQERQDEMSATKFEEESLRAEEKAFIDERRMDSQELRDQAYADYLGGGGARGKGGAGRLGATALTPAQATAAIKERVSRARVMAGVGEDEQFELDREAYEDVEALKAIQRPGYKARPYGSGEKESGGVGAYLKSLFGVAREGATTGLTGGPAGGPASWQQFERKGP